MNAPRAQLVDFFGREWQRLAAWVRRRLDDEAAREGHDLVGEVFAALFARPDDELPARNLPGYVYAALGNRVVDRLRRRRSTVPLDTPVGGEGLTLSDILPAPDEGAGESERAARVEALRQALAELDEPSRRIIHATEFEGATFRELAAAWGVPIGTLLARKSRALRRLAVALSEHRP